MRARPFAFDVVVFDLDGTLVATDQFWPQAAREGALRAFGDLGLPPDLPSAAGWMSLVGQPLEVGFERLFPSLDEAQRAHLIECCVEEEHRALARRGASFLPGVEPALRALHGRGVRMGIASNCSRAYLEQVCAGLGLERWIAERRCLDSPGVRDKADMVADILQSYGSRSAVMVGDRRGDRDAAWANALPHVHLARGYAGADELVECEAVIDGLDELVPLLERREARLDALVHELALGARPAVIGIGGTLLSGKSLLARDLARALEAAGRRAAVLELEDFQREPPRPRGEGEQAVESWLAAYDVEQLLNEVLRPHRRGERASLRRRAPDACFPERQREVALELSAGADLLLVGAELAHPRLMVHTDRLIWLTISDELTRRRLAGREGRESGLVALERVAGLRLPYEAALRALHLPSLEPDLCLSGENPLGG